MTLFLTWILLVETLESEELTIPGHSVWKPAELGFLFMIFNIKSHLIFEGGPLK
ncbi:hypothetical protein SAMN05444162_2187 [Paenibacillaceae bacterium GAS479]|nr:hypothetical protein SAMN05444162_2187 [Paenibacillaceae bacterium GAS479]